MCLFVVAIMIVSYFSDRIAVLVMVSKAESIVLYLSSCSIRYTCQNIDFLPSLRFLHPG